MTFTETQVFDTIARIAPNRYVQSLLIAVLSALLAKLVDLILSRFISRLIKFTFD